MNQMVYAVAAALAAVSTADARSTEDTAQEVIELPAPTGPHGVGTAVWHWVDETPDPPREIMAQLWYPGDTDGATGTRYRPLGGADFEAVRSYAVAGAPFAELDDPAPLIVLCPGRGTNRYYYSSLAEDLASRGYAVFAIDSPGIGYVEYPDGRSVEPSAEYRPSFELITGPYEKVDKFFEPAVELGLADLNFALVEVMGVNEADPARRLTDKIETKIAGAFGHSLGGRICGALAHSNEGVVAFAAMEGVPPRDARRGGLDAATLMLYSSELPEEMALPNIREVFDNRGREATILRLEGFGHNSVTDRPLIFADSYDHAVDTVRGIEITRELLASFFDAHLRGGRFAPEQHAKRPEVTIVETSVRGQKTDTSGW